MYHTDLRTDWQENSWVEEALRVLENQRMSMTQQAEKASVFSTVLGSV